MGSKTEDHSGQIKNGPIAETRTGWNNLQKGDECFIVGDLEGVYRFQEWFIYESGVECVQLYGGPKGYAKTRFVGADVVSTDQRVSAPVSGADGPEPTDTPVGDFRARREALKLSRTKLAELAGTTHAAVASIEAGRAARDKDAAAKMTAVLWPKDPLTQLVEIMDEQQHPVGSVPVVNGDYEDDPDDEEDEW